eukprot:scaffold15971_cov76-Phaeocystis_antarctica.AAC.2
MHGRVHKDFVYVAGQQCEWVRVRVRASLGTLSTSPASNVSQTAQQTGRQLDTAEAADDHRGRLAG